MKKTNQLYIALAAGLLLIGSFGSCKKEDHDHDDGEVITTVKLEFADSATGRPAGEFVFSDPDGPGGNAPVRFDTIRLAENRTYTVKIILLDESKTPAEDITKEVKEEAKEHLFCFTPSGVQVNILRTDSDGTYEVGLESRWITGIGGAGKVKVVLKHQPNVKNGDCAPGDTDVEVDFPIEIQR